MFYPVLDADDWWRESELEGRQRHHARSQRFVGWHSTEMFALRPSERNDFNTTLPHGWDHEPNRSLGVPTPVMYSYLADHLRMSGSKVRDHLSSIAEIMFEFMTLGAFPRTDRQSSRVG